MFHKQKRGERERKIKMKDERKNKSKSKSYHLNLKRPYFLIGNSYCGKHTTKSTGLTTYAIMVIFEAKKACLDPQKHV
jgi:hypothetical protein